MDGVMDPAAGTGAFLASVPSAHMSRADAVMHLMRLMSGRTLSPEECEAVGMAIRAIFKRFKCDQVRWARRRAANRLRLADADEKPEGEGDGTNGQ